MKLQSMTLAALVGVAGLLLAPAAFGASHREAPLIAQDPSADITDVYAFVSYDEANLNRAPADQRVTLIMNVVPGQDPADGPITSISRTTFFIGCTSTTTPTALRKTSFTSSGSRPRRGLPSVPSPVRSRSSAIPTSATRLSKGSASSMVPALRASPAARPTR